MKFLDRIDGLNKFKAFLTLLATLVVSLIVVYIPFLIRGNALVWVGMAKDAMTQGVTYLEHVKNNGYLSSIGNYDYWLGLGADYLTSLSFFSLFDPFNLIYFILPFHPLISYSFTMAFKSLACGIIFYIYISNKGVSNSRSIMLSLMYMLTGFVCFTFVRHYNLTAGPIYFPLIIMGLERAYDGKRPYMLIICVFLCLITNFYVFFSATVLAVMYVLIKHFVLVKQGKLEGGAKAFIKKFSYLGLVYLIGTLLASFMLIPNFYGYMQAARSSSKGYPIFEPYVFLANLSTFLLPIQAPRYGHMYLNIAILIMGICAVLTKNRETKHYRIIVVVLTAGFLLPVFGYAMNIFNYCNNRWSYALSFFIFVLIGLNSKAGEVVYNSKKVKKINAVLFGYFGLILIAGVLSIVALLGYGLHLIWGIILCVGIGFGVFFLIKKGKGLGLFKKYYKQSILFPLATVITLCYCLGYYFIYSSTFNSKFVYEFLHTEQEEFVSSENQKELFRTDVEYNTSWYDSFDNRPVNNEYMGTHSYNSISNKYVYEFFKENGIYNPPQNLGTFGFNGRSALQSLTSVKYTYSDNGLYHNFSAVENQKNLYRNNNYNSFGFVFTDTISREKYNSLKVLDRQYVLLEGVLLEDIEKGTLDDNIDSKNYIVKDYNKEFDKEIKNGVEYKISEVRGKEVYLVIEGVKEVDSLNVVKFSCNGIEKELSFYQKGNLMYTDQRDVYLYFGVQEEDDITIEVTTVKGKGLVAETVKVVTADQIYLNNHIQSAPNLERMKNLTFNSNSINGEVNLSYAGHLFFSIPYSTGWKVFVDGEEKELLRADTAFMAVEIESGFHRVELKYYTPYLDAGKAVSLASIIMLVATCLGYEIIRYRTKKEH